MSKRFLQKNLIYLSLLTLPAGGCSRQQTAPKLRADPQLSLKDGRLDAIKFDLLPKLLETGVDHATFEYSSTRNALMYTTFEAGNHTPHTPESIYSKAETDQVRQQGVLKNKLSRISFHRLPKGERLRFYFFLKDIYRNETSMMRYVDVDLKQPRKPAQITSPLTTAYQGQPFSMDLDIKDDCDFYELENAPSWLRYQEARFFGTPDSQAELGKKTFTLRGQVEKDCIAEQSFTIEVIGDPLTKDSWHLDNKGQKSYAWFGALPGLDINLHLANELGLTGQGIHVRVADTGMQIDHPDLIDNINHELNVNIEAKNPQGCAVCDPKDTTPFIEEGSVGDQGTAVAGIIAAKAWNGIGSRGIAPNATLSAINITSLRMNEDYVTQEQQLDGEFDVLNQSWSKANLQKETYTPLPVGYFELQKSKVVNARQKLGSVIIKAAGDDHLRHGEANLDPFNTMPWQIVVGSLSSNGLRSFDSTTGSALWLSAPGGDAGFQSEYRLMKERGFPRYLFQPAILSTDLFYAKSPCTVGFAKYAAQFLPRNNETKPVQHMVGEASGFNLGWDRKNNPNCAYAATVHGSMAAAPMVSGAVALLLEHNPKLTWRDIKHILAKTARKVDRNFTQRYTTLGEQRVVGVMPWTRNAAGYKYHNWYGFGALDISEALRVADSKTYQPLPPLIDSNWLPVFGGGGAITGQKLRGLEKQFNSNSEGLVETVSIKLNLSTPKLGKIGVELRSPSGTSSIMLAVNNGSFASDARDFTLLSNAFYGEPMRGKWTLSLLSNINEEEGVASLESWFIRFTGHKYEK